MPLSPEGVDEEFQGLLDFGDGQRAQIASSFTQPYRHEVELLGSAGRIRIPTAFVNGSEPLWFELEDADGTRERIDVPGDDEYRLEVEDFAACVRDGRQPQVVSHPDTLANMATIDALYESARSGRVFSSSLARQRQVDPAALAERQLDGVDHLLHPARHRRSCPRSPSPPPRISSMKFAVRLA